jgi:hypothetical protein
VICLEETAQDPQDKGLEPVEVLAGEDRVPEDGKGLVLAPAASVYVLLAENAWHTSRVYPVLREYVPIADSMWSENSKIGRHNFIIAALMFLVIAAGITDIGLLMKYNRMPGKNRLSVWSYNKGKNYAYL